MSKFSGCLGFAIIKEHCELDESTGKMVRTGRMDEHIVEKPAFGDILQFSFGSKNNENQSNIDDLRLSNRFSVIGNTYFFENFHLMKYVLWSGVKWKVTNVNVEFPRLVITVGDVYNE